MPKVIIVGGVAGGATTAAQLRRIDPDIDITIYEKGRDISYGNCGLPYHIGGEVAERDQLIAATPESFLERDIIVKTHHQVIGVDAGSKTIQVKDVLNGGTFEAEYDYLVLSPGGAPRTIPTLLDVPQAFVLHSLEHLDEIKAHIENKNIERAVVVGGGYIGLEMVENLVRRGIRVTLVHRAENLYHPLESDMSGFIADELEAKGVDVKLNAEILDVDGDIATLSTGEEIDAPMIVAGIGITPRTDFLKDSDVAMNDAGYVCVDQYGRTNHEEIYAVGDAIETSYQHVDRPVNVALAWSAHRMAYVISNQISGDKTAHFEGLLGTNIIRFFDYDIATLGLEISELKEYPHFVIDHKQKNKAGYMADSVPIHVRLHVAQSDGKILRAAVVGTEGVDKRIDVLSAHIRLGGTAMDLANIEVAYSPPYSSPKSVLNMVGYKTMEKMNRLKDG
ncbi:CoA-disulfide reductase [Salinicoccus hispanicus]|uniref:CoA-disulfide reductase n=1 Tax=Salinicoccus hispanicus TaxID=157225 RepID=A0A6N8TY07_9STAP|nr:CoA-disulfide reductase [Salinicoccus hispanicus]MXQ50848.1 CoA-disulfide reductase [Salinicoccus hispanicus]